LVSSFVLYARWLTRGFVPQDGGDDTLITKTTTAKNPRRNNDINPNNPKQFLAKDLKYNNGGPS